MDPDSATKTVQVGDMLYMKCTAGPGVSLVWSHKGMTLRSNSRVVITTARDVHTNNIYALVSIRDVTAEDGGNYE